MLTEWVTGDVGWNRHALCTLHNHKSTHTLIHSTLTGCREPCTSNDSKWQSSYRSVDPRKHHTARKSTSYKEECNLKTMGSLLTGFVL